jgi:hypothetical protein
MPGEFPDHAAGSTHSRHAKKRYWSFGLPKVRRGRRNSTGDPIPDFAEESNSSRGTVEKSKKAPRRTAEFRPIRGHKEGPKERADHECEDLKNERVQGQQEYFLRKVYGNEHELVCNPDDDQRATYPSERRVRSILRRNQCLYPCASANVFRRRPLTVDFMTCDISA